MMHLSKKLTVVLTICLLIGAARILAQNKEHHEDPSNIKVLPKHITDVELHTIMKAWSMSLGVRCNFCHAMEKGQTGDKPRLNFESDEKPEKEMARKMYRMTNKINSKYLDKMASDEGKLSQITCVTCHMGRPHPVVNVDSLAKN